MAKCDKCGKTTFGGINHNNKLFCSESCKKSFKEFVSVICGKCGTENQLDEKTCQECGDYLHQYKEQQEQEYKSIDKSSSMKKLGLILLLLGSLIAGYYYLLFDTSVEVPTTEIMGQTFGGGRVHNIGLLQEKQSGGMIGGGLAVFGLIITLIASSKK